MKASCTKHFPGYMKGALVDELVSAQLTQEGFIDEVLLNTECSFTDEINSPDDNISSLMTKRWGEIFSGAKMTGFPFTDKIFLSLSVLLPLPVNNITIFSPNIILS